MSDIGQRVIARVKQIAAESPNFIYEKPEDDQCRYIFGGEGSCLIGCALLAEGLIDLSLEHKGMQSLPFGLGYPNETDVKNLFAFLDIHVDDDELVYLSGVQDLQDAGRTWGYAVSHAG